MYDALYVIASEVLLENLACVDGEHGERRHVDLSARIAYKLVISNVADGLYLLNVLHSVLDRHTEVGEDDHHLLFLVLRGRELFEAFLVDVDDVLPVLHEADILLDS